MTKKMITFRLEPEIDDKVKEEARKNNIEVSSQYRDIVKHYFLNPIRKLFK